MADYLANVQEYDKGADEEIVSKIVKHLGIALRNKDSSLVAASDPKELERVVESWAMKKLGASESDGQAAVSAVAEEMKGDRSKCRVAFYYLVAKELGKLGDL